MQLQAHMSLPSIIQEHGYILYEECQRQQADQDMIIGMGVW